MKKSIIVKMADYKICHSPQKITTLGLGSCLGVVLYDDTAKVCGLAHIMLPDSEKFTNSNRNNPMKFADTCIKMMYDDLLKSGASPERIAAKIAGGAKMFQLKNENDIMNVGTQNCMAVKKLLADMKIKIVAEDIGKDYSRTVTFLPENGEYHIKAVGMGEYII